ncbi:sodium- and chloride-dependent GABA transporter 1-like [Tachypleus tridentatus]|uniref:sodium- and chloride-dependent GABA transporter 1-like n=1 Tax=Tachypleus tridentatus TaxID=6853 RepID=UPI003FD228BB
MITTPDEMNQSVRKSDKEKEPERGEWKGKLDFVLSSINYAVGLGNVWRFPYLCYENGGGAFLFPYLICLVLCAVPLFFLEVAIGQYLSVGGIGVWNLVPIFKGIGFASMTIVCLNNIYYVVIIAWTLFYFVFSMTSQLPWESCGNWWNTKYCMKEGTNITNLNITATEAKSPVTEFWERRTLQITSGIHDLGGVNMELSLCLLLAWFLVYLVIWKGLQSSGKIIKVSAVTPYVILIVLFIRGVTLEGAGDGLLFYITPQFDKLFDPKVWVTAGTQVFFTFGIGFGSVVTLGSYNKFSHNFFRDGYILCLVNPATSIFAGSVIFSVLGHMAYLKGDGTEVADVVKSGPGLAFLTYPEVVLQLPPPPLWATVFFFMLLILGINSQFCTVESFITGIVDEWPSLLRSRRKAFTIGIVIILYTLGLPMVTKGGMYIFQLMDYYSASGMTLLFTVFFQTIAITWVYGVKRLSSNIEEMTGYRPNWYFLATWVFVSPAVCLGIFLFSVMRYKPLVYAETYVYPWWGELLGWGIALASMVWIPSYAVYFMLVTPGSLKDRLIAGITPRLRPSKI